jgi:DNA-binding protein H-NS
MPPQEPTLQELLAQKDALEKQIESTKKQHRADAIAKVRALMAEFGLTMADLAAKSAPRGSASKGSKVAPKYRNPATGDTWSGRGLQPKWLRAAVAAGRKVEEFLV